MICKWFRKKKETPLEDSPKHYVIAHSKLGLKEIYGSGNNPLIVDMFKLVTGKEYPDSTAWCAAFTGACLVEAGLPSTTALNARSYLDYGTPVDKPKVGDIVVLWRKSRDSWQGHVGFFVKDSLGFIHILGGNQNDSVSIARYPKYRLLGYRRV